MVRTMSSAAALKVSMAASVYRTRPYDLHRLRRTIATAASSVDSSRTIPAVAAKASLALNSKAELISAVAWTTTLPSCAPSAHVKATNLGFRGHTHNNSNRRSFAFSSSSSLPSSSSVDKGPSSASEMGADNDKFDDSDGWRLDHRPQPPPSPSQPQSSKFLTLPTVLTLGRVAAVPVLICTFYVDSCWGTTATTSIFIAAAVTDWLDGYIARKMKLGTAFGAFLDPVADKLMVAATLVLLCTKPLEISTYGHLPWLLTVPAIVIIGREITMSAVREWAASQNSKLLEAVAVNNLGKWKTATQMTALTILLAARDSSLAGARMLVAPGVILLNVSAGLAMWSLVVYMRKIWKVLLK